MAFGHFRKKIHYNQNAADKGVRLQKMKTASLALVLVSTVSAASCFVNFSAAGLPYQDATSVQLASQQENLCLWGAFFLLSIFALVIGMLGFRRIWKSKRDESDAST
jgi:hypothetical protein